PQDLLPLRPRDPRPELAQPLVPGAAHGRGRGDRRAPGLPGDALLGPGAGRPALHRPERPALRRPLAAGRRPPSKPRPARPAGDRDGLADGGRRPRRRPRRRRAPPGGGGLAGASGAPDPLAEPRRPRPRAAHGGDLPPPGGKLPDGTG